MKLCNARPLFRLDQISQKSDYSLSLRASLKAHLQRSVRQLLKLLLSNPSRPRQFEARQFVDDPPVLKFPFPLFLDSSVWDQTAAYVGSDPGAGGGFGGSCSGFVGGGGAGLGTELDGGGIPGSAGWGIGGDGSPGSAG